MLARADTPFYKEFSKTFATFRFATSSLLQNGLVCLWDDEDNSDERKSDENSLNSQVPPPTSSFSNEACDDWTDSS